MSGNDTLVEREWRFIRYVGGKERAEGVTITKAKTDEEAFAAAARICPSPGSHGPTVLVLASSPSITKLEADNARLREALEPFGLAADAVGEMWGGQMFIGNLPHMRDTLFVGDLRRARAALKENGQ